MHRLIATSTILEHELSELRLLVERQTGIVLDCPNSALAAHIVDYIEAQGLGSAATVLERLRSPDQDRCGWPSVLDGLISVNTGFFVILERSMPWRGMWCRNFAARKSVDGPSPLPHLERRLLYGEETYTIAMAVCDALSQSSAHSGNNGNSNGNEIRNSKWRHRRLRGEHAGTEISVRHYRFTS